MQSVIVKLSFLFILLPYALVAFFGLALGAALPPSLYGRRTWLALVLNVVGFLIYAWPAFMLGVVLCAPDFMVHITTGETCLAAALALGVFGVVEAAAFLRRRRSPC